MPGVLYAIALEIVSAMAWIFTANRFSVFIFQDNHFSWWVDQNGLCHSHVSMKQFVVSICDIHTIYVYNMSRILQLVPFNNINFISLCCWCHMLVTCCISYRLILLGDVFGMHIGKCICEFLCLPLVCNPHLATCLQATMHYSIRES